MAANYTSTGADTFPAGVVRSFAVARALSNLVLTTTYQDVGSMSIAVTPKTTSSKFWIEGHFHLYFSPTTSAGWETCWTKIVVTPAGGSAAIVEDDEDYGSDAYGWGKQNVANADRMSRWTIMSLHSPSSETAQTFKLMAKYRENDGNITLNKFNAGWMSVTEIG
jgi:hypothetical protein